MKGIYSCVLLLLCLCCLAALIDGANQIYMASDRDPELRLDGEIYSHSGYPTTPYRPNIYTLYNLTSLLYPGVTTALIMRFSNPFSISPRDDYGARDETCQNSDYLYVAGVRYCNWRNKPVINRDFSTFVGTRYAYVAFDTTFNYYGFGFGFTYRGLELSESGAVFIVVAAVIDNDIQNTDRSLYPSLSGHTEGYITSHLSYPSNYTANISSSITLQGLNSGQQLTIIFLDFSIYYHNRFPGCNHDYLSISDTTGEKQRFCQDSAHAPMVNQSYNYHLSERWLTLRFVTNGNPTASRGFLLKYAVSTTATTTATMIKPSTTATTTSTATTAKPSTTKLSTAKSSTASPTSAKSSTRIPSTVVTSVSERSIITTKPRGTTTNRPTYAATTILQTAFTTTTTYNASESNLQTMSDEASKGSKQRIIPIASGVSAGVVIIVVVLVIIILYSRRSKRPRKSASVDYGYSYSPGGDDSVVDQRTATNQQSTAAHLYADEYSSLSDALSGQSPPSAQTTPGTGVNGSEYTLAEEITSEPACNPERTTPADSSSPPTSADSRGGVYDLANDYQLAAAAGDEYENFESVKRSEEDKNMTDTYAAITASTKKLKSRKCDTVTELVDNDLYGT